MDKAEGKAQGAEKERDRRRRKDNGGSGGPADDRTGG